MSSGLYKLFIISLTLLIITLGVLTFFAIKNERAKNAELLMDEEKLVYRKEKLSEEKAFKEEYYYRLLHDDKFADRIIRQKLGFVGQGEIVFRFEDSEPVSIDDTFESKNAPLLNMSDSDNASSPSQDSMPPLESERKSFVIEKISFEEKASTKSESTLSKEPMQTVNLNIKEEKPAEENAPNELLSPSNSSNTSSVKLGETNRAVRSNTGAAKAAVKSSRTIKFKAE